MNNNDSFEDPHALLKRYGLHAKKSWGQNFLVKRKAVEQIARACVDIPGRKVIEIGAGLGTLTQVLVGMGANVIAVERDPDMCEVLNSEFSKFDNFVLESADAATFDYAKCLGNENGVIAGNLPYQITGRIMRRVLDTHMPMLKAVFMVQEEVAQRICAQPKDKARGALSVITDVRCNTKILMHLSPKAFTPKPKVNSAIIELIPRQTALIEKTKLKIFDKTVKAAFSSRRKTIRNSMLSCGFCTANQADTILNAAKISPTIRAEKLETADFVALTLSVAQNIDRISLDKI